MGSVEIIMWQINISHRFTIHDSEQLSGKISVRWSSLWSLFVVRSWTGCGLAVCLGDQPLQVALWREAFPGWGVAAPTGSRTSTAGWVRLQLGLCNIKTGFQERCDLMRWETAAWVFPSVWWLAERPLLQLLFSFGPFLTQLCGDREGNLCPLEFALWVSAVLCVSRSLTSDRR